MSFVGKKNTYIINKTSDLLIKQAETEAETTRKLDVNVPIVFVGLDVSILKYKFEQLLFRGWAIQ